MNINDKYYTLTSEKTQSGMPRMSLFLLKYMCLYVHRQWASGYNMTCD